MAISAPSKSSQYTDYATNNAKVAPNDWGSKLRTSFSKLTFTAAGFTTAAAGDIQMVRMPAGKVRILVDQCRLICPAGTALSDLDVGVSAYTKMDGSTQALAGAALADSLDVGAGALDQALPLPTNGLYEVESASGFDIVCSFDTANSPASGDMYLWIVYQQGN
ncbi:hypothetical protein [Caudoviricetes sp.]|nr:hypothetical protein [Caudoviricetes sp.]